MQIAVAVSVATVLVPMLFAAIACYVYIHYPGGNNELNWLSNKGSHGFTTMFYEYVSSVAGNGSNFGGLANNTAFLEYLNSNCNALWQVHPYYRRYNHRRTLAAKEIRPFVEREPVSRSFYIRPISFCND